MSLQLISYIKYKEPVYVLKELIENSIDSGSKFLNIKLKKYGLMLIEVEDDGCGISKKDLRLCLFGKATSKISKISDIKHIKYYGYMGNSLSMISSISKINIISKPKKQEYAWGVFVNDFESNIFPDLYNDGTRVSVENLYYNLPENIKNFFRYDNYYHIEKIVKNFLLGYLNISFKVTYDQRSIFYPSCDNFLGVKKRLSRIFGNVLINNSLYIDFSENNINLKGWFGLPNFDCKLTDNKFVFINDKIIKNSYINNIINYSYYYINNKFLCNFFCLYLYLDYSMIDMSFYKSECEIFFLNEQNIYNLLKKSILFLFSDKNININDISTSIGKKFKTKKSFLYQYIKKKSIKININKNIYEFLCLVNNEILLLKFKDQLLIIHLLKFRFFLLWNKCVFQFKKFGFLKKIYIKNVKIDIIQQMNSNVLLLLNDLGICFFYEDDKTYLKSFPFIFSIYNINYNLFINNLLKKIYEFNIVYIDVIFFYKYFIHFIIDHIVDNLYILELKEMLLFVDNNVNREFYKFFKIDDLFSLI